MLGTGQARIKIDNGPLDPEGFDSGSSWQNGVGVTGEIGKKPNER